jgi:predicted glycoside hydrolase/deacetylase ChbG (UPF0249 family)
VRNVILCADDYGLSDNVNEAILDMADRGQISAVSCMTSLPGWKSSARAIRELRNTLDLGVHLTLTNRNVGQALLRTVTNRLTEEAIYSEFKRQCQLFESEIGAPPRFLDGHHHVHQLTPMARALIRLQKSLPTELYVRNTAMPLGKILRQGIAPAKTLLISRQGYVFKEILNRKKMTTNDGFAGIYAPTGYNPIRTGKIFRIFAKNLDGISPIWMIHPGRKAKSLSADDPWAAAREAEYQVLKSPEFQDFLSAEGIRLARFFQTKNIEAGVGMDGLGQNHSPAVTSSDIFKSVDFDNVEVDPMSAMEVTVKPEGKTRAGVEQREFRSDP